MPRLASRLDEATAAIAQCRDEKEMRASERNHRRDFQVGHSRLQLGNPVRKTFFSDFAASSGTRGGDIISDQQDFVSKDASNFGVRDLYPSDALGGVSLWKDDREE